MSLNSPRCLADIDNGLSNGVGRLDRLGVRLEISLRRDHIHELRGQVDVRGLEGTRLNVAEGRRTGLAQQRITRLERLAPGRIAKLLQAFCAYRTTSNAANSATLWYIVSMS